MPITSAKHLQITSIYPLMSGAMMLHDVLSVSALLLLCFCTLQFSLLIAAVGAFITIYLLMITTFQTRVSAIIQNQQMPNYEMPSRLVIYNTDVQLIHNCSAATASRKIKLAKEYYEKKEHQVLTIKEYCTYWSLEYDETCKFLKLL